MAYDHEEQEQLEAIKAWWSKNGNLVTWTVIIALSIFVAWKGWGIYQGKQAVQASQLFEEQQAAVESKDAAKVLRAAQDMQDKFAGTAYAQMSGLVAAKSAFDANDIAATKAQLEWVLENAQDEEYKAIAATRLAGVLLDEKSYDLALNVLSGKFSDQFASVIADRRGDVFVAQGKRDEARAAFALALEKAQADDPARQLIQLKLDALGGASDKKVS